jgi:hypothetical protein
MRNDNALPPCLSFCPPPLSLSTHKVSFMCYGMGEATVASTTVHSKLDCGDFPCVERLLATIQHYLSLDSSPQQLRQVLCTHIYMQQPIFEYVYRIQQPIILEYLFTAVLSLLSAVHGNAVFLCVCARACLWNSVYVSVCVHKQVHTHTHTHTNTHTHTHTHTHAWPRNAA